MEIHKNEHREAVNSLERNLHLNGQHILWVSSPCCGSAVGPHWCEMRFAFCEFVFNQQCNFRCSTALCETNKDSQNAFGTKWDPTRPKTELVRCSIPVQNWEIRNPKASHLQLWDLPGWNNIGADLTNLFVIDIHKTRKKAREICSPVLITRPEALLTWCLLWHKNCKNEELVRWKDAEEWVGMWMDPFCC